MDDIEQEATELAVEFIKETRAAQSQARFREETPLPNEAIPDSAHYRVSAEDARCRNCLHFKDGYCEEWAAGVNPDAVCDEYEPYLSITNLGGG